jgi:hypothetical protein
MHRSRAFAGVATVFVLGVAAPTMADLACKPVLKFSDVRFSAAQNQQRKWRATIAVDASRCGQNSGLFEIKFVRLKEFGPDLLFTERFSWRPVAVEASLDF